MRCRWLGWAGVEIEHDDQRLVIDPLIQTGALYAALGEAAAGVKLPEVVQPHAERDALAGLLTHLHRDHADAFALTQALSESAPILLPAAEPVRGAAAAAI